MKCPVCNKDFKNKIGVNIHLMKFKDEGHIQFVNNQIHLIKELYNKQVPSTKISEISVFGVPTILKLLKKNFENFEENKFKLCSIKNKKSKKRSLRIDEAKKEKIKNLFNTEFSLTDIGKMCGCNYNTVKRVFNFYFGAHAVKNRGLKYRKGARPSRIKKKDPKLYQKIIDAFATDLSIKELCRLFAIDCSTLQKCWKTEFGMEKYNERKIKNIPIQKERGANGIKKACFVGSKNEIYCCNLLKQNYNVVHHDYSIVPGLEIDMVLPDKKIAIGWDGVWHRRIITDSSSLRRIQKNDKIKENKILEIAWRYIIVEDNGKFNPKFVEQKVKEIVDLINKDFQGKVVI